MVEKIELRNCPFCGSNEVELYYESDSWGMSAFAIAYVACKRCHAHGPIVEGNTLTEDMKEVAMNIWNGVKNG